MLEAEAVDLRKACDQQFRVDVRDVKKDVVSVGLLHTVEDCAGDDIARGEFGAVVVAGHESLAFDVAEDAAFAAGEEFRFGKGDDG